MMLVCVSSAKFWILEKNKQECKRGNKRLRGFLLGKHYECCWHLILLDAAGFRGT